MIMFRVESDAKFETPVAPSAPMLPDTVVFTKVMVPDWTLLMAAPSDSFPDTVVLVTVTVPWKLAMPPAPPEEVFPWIVEPSIVTIPAEPLEIPAAPFAALLETVVSDTCVTP
jgi:hypothetical protein